MLPLTFVTQRPLPEVAADFITGASCEASELESLYWFESDERIWLTQEQFDRLRLLVIEARQRSILRNLVSR